LGMDVAGEVADISCHVLRLGIDVAGEVPLSWPLLSVALGLFNSKSNCLLLWVLLHSVVDVDADDLE
jgi:hypothetical protein